MSIINFTLNYDQFASGDDTTDGGVDADIVPLIGTVTATPQFVDDRPAMAADYSPRPAGFKIRTFTGYLDTDGQLRASVGGPVGMRLWANDPVLDLARLVYRIDFDLTTPLGEVVKVQGGYLEAPATDTAVNIAVALESTGSPTVGRMRVGMYAGDIIDSGSTGQEIVRSATDSDFWNVVGTVPTGNLPAYVDDVLEFASVAAFPVTGASGKIYLALDTTPAQSYRWSGSAYFKIAAQTTAEDIINAGTVGRRVVKAVDAASVRLAAGIVTATAFDQGDGIAYV